MQILKAFTILDTETTGLDIVNDEIVELAVSRYVEPKWESNSLLFNTEKPIPFEASAIHNISRNMVVNKPKFSENIKEVLSLLKLDLTDYLVSHNVEYDYPILINNFKRAKQENLLGKFNDKNNWICTLRLAKQFLPEILETNGANYKLSYLRYALNLNPENEETAAHRAEIDTIVCEKLLKFLIETGVKKKILNTNEELGQQLSKICWSPIKITKWPIKGKHFLRDLKDIPFDYFSWALENIDKFKENNPNYDADLSSSVIEVLSERLK